MHRGDNDNMVEENAATVRDILAPASPVYWKEPYFSMRSESSSRFCFIVIYDPTPSRAFVSSPGPT
jgi:hypothetical protein